MASSKTAGSIFNAKVIVDQAQIVSAFSLKYIDLSLRKTGSPTDNVLIEFRSGSITGTLLGTSNNVDASTVQTTAPPPTLTRFTFATPISLSASTKYYFSIKRSGTLDTTNEILFYRRSADVLANGGLYTKNNGTWTSESATEDATFVVYDTNTFPVISQTLTTGSLGINGTGDIEEEEGQSFTTNTTASTITKLEAQYLLLNTADGGTGLQTYQTLWDSTEWDDTSGGLPTFKYSHDATNAADSSKLVDIDNSNTDVSGATVTGANQQISAAFTMPTTGHQVDTNVTVSTGVVGAVRIIAYYAVTSTPFVPTAIANTTKLLMGVGI